MSILNPHRPRTHMGSNDPPDESGQKTNHSGFSSAKAKSRKGSKAQKHLDFTAPDSRLQTGSGNSISEPYSPTDHEMGISEPLVHAPTGVDATSLKTNPKNSSSSVVSSQAAQPNASSPKNDTSIETKTHSLPNS